jgi:hypothetical protein
MRTSGRWRVKVSLITQQGTASQFSDVVEAAWTTGSSVLQGVPEAEIDTNVAFLTIHVGLAAVWLLVDRWEDGDILRHHHFRAPLKEPTRFTDVSSDHYGPCVWELAVQAHERQAWLTHVLANSNGADIEAYLTVGLSGSV